MRLAAPIATLCLLPALAAAQEQQVRSFMLVHRSASQAISVVAPMLTPEGSVVLQPRQNTLVVRDTPEAVASIGEFLARWDVGPLTYHLEIRLLLASNVEPTPRPGGPHFSDQATAAMRAVETPRPRGPHFRSLEDDLRRFFPFKFFTKLDTLSIEATEGTVVEALAAGEYMVRFQLQSLASFPNRVQLDGLELLRGAGRAAVPAGQPLVRSTVSLRVGQTSVIGAARSEDAEQALILVLTALRAEQR